MPFLRTGSQLLLVGAVLAGSPSLAQAQRPPRVATRIDSLRAVRDGAFNQSLPAYYTAVLTFASGKRVSGYIEVDSYLASWNLFNRMYCYEVPPDHLPLPPIKVINIERLKSVSVNGHLLESLVVRGRSLKILVENLATGGRLRLYAYYTTKDEVVFKNFWYVRVGDGPFREIPRGHKAFAGLMTTMFADFPALAARVKAQEKGAGFDDMPMLLQEYNTHFAAK